MEAGGAAGGGGGEPPPPRWGPPPRPRLPRARLPDGCPPGALASAPVQCSSGAGTTNSRMGFTPPPPPPPPPLPPPFPPPRPRRPRARLPDACPPGSPPLRATEGRPRACLSAKRLGGRVGSCRLRSSHRRRGD